MHHVLIVLPFCGLDLLTSFNMRESAIGNDAVKPDSHLNWNRFECFEVKLGQKFAVEHQISIKFVIKKLKLEQNG